MKKFGIMAAAAAMIATVGSGTLAQAEEGKTAEHL